MDTIQTILFSIQIVTAVLMILMILFQKNDSDALSGMGASNGMGANSILSSSASGNILTKITIFLIFVFMVNGLVLATISARKGRADQLIIQKTIEEKEQKNKKESGELEIPEM